MTKSIKIISLIMIVFAIISISNIGNISSLFYDKETISENLIFGDVETEIIEECDTKPVIAGSDFKKIVKIKNTGVSPCFVRIMILTSPEEYKNELNLDINTNDWEYKDGYYYYKEVLNANDETTPLFTKVHIPSVLEKGDIFDINIYSESIQTTLKGKDITNTKDCSDFFNELIA